MPSLRRSLIVSEIDVAQATLDDVRTIQARRSVDDVSMRLALAAADHGAAWVARDDGAIVGIALADVTSDERYVGDLFVEPSFRGQGIGGRLLDAAFDDTGEAARALIVDPSQAAGFALALRRGLGLRFPVLRLAGGIPKEETLAKMAAGEYRFDVDAIDVRRHGFALDAIDRECRGIVRSAQHESFALAATGQAFFLNGEMVAYSYVWPDGRIGPFASSSANYGVQLFAFALVTLARTYGASWCTLLVPGTNVRIARAALRAGLRIEDNYALAAQTWDADASRYVAYHRLSL